MIVVLYVMDSLRSDYLSCYGYAKAISPNIDRLAQEGVLFTNAFAQSTWTRSSGASLLSSTYPSVHGVFTARDYFSDSIPRLPELLLKSGFNTIAVSAIGNISTDFGFGRGFERFVELYKDQALLQKRANLNIRKGGRKLSWIAASDYVPISTSEDINQFLFPLLRDRGDANMFLLVWSMDTHGPYFHRDPQLARSSVPSDAVWAPREFLEMHSENELRRLKALYEDMIYYNDYHLGILIEKLKEWDLFEQTLLILTSDHGESFSEHGVNSHGTAPYDELIRIPLIIKFPHSQCTGKVDGLVQHIDLAPTILEMAGSSGEGMLIQGNSLLPLLRGKEKTNDFVFVEFQRNERLPRYTAIRTLDYKYMEVKPGKFAIQGSVLQTLSPLVRSVIKQRYLFSVKEAGEKVNLIRKRKEMAKYFQKQVDRIAKNNAELSKGLKKVGKGEIGVDKQVARQLEALGYFD